MLKQGFIVVLVTLVADWATKVAVLEWVKNGGGYQPVTDFFNLVLVWNKGVSFGLFSNDSHLGPWLLSGFALVVVAYLIHLLRKADSIFLALAYGLIIGGALGNVYDRVVYGAVVDFLDFHWQGYHWPAFNIADSGIVVGVGVLLIDSFRKRPEEDQMQDG